MKPDDTTRLRRQSLAVGISVAAVVLALAINAYSRDGLTTRTLLLFVAGGAATGAAILAFFYKPGGRSTPMDSN